MGFSKWLKLDLHIHSIKSNDKKINDYDGKEYTAKELIEKLKVEEINIFSITDHNTLNVKLYEELEKIKEEILEEDINFLIGVELDIHDSKISAETFHCLLFFDSDDLDLEIKAKAKFIEELYSDDKIPDMGEIFSSMQKNKFRNFILIPHYNNKNKGIKENKMKKLMTKEESPTLHLLNISVFDAFEDTNNIDQIQKSLKKYSDAGYDDLPILIFSDNHNLTKYPEGKNGNKSEFRYILGNINYPFNSIKLSFKEADLRMGFSNAGTGRVITPFGKHIKTIKYNKTQINMSPYQNTIVGGFGSGKSFLKNLIITGKDKLDKKYADLDKLVENFEIELSDGVMIKSLSESQFELLILDQNEEIFFASIITEEYKEKLQTKFLLDFPELKYVYLGEEQELELLRYYKQFSEKLEENIADTIIYEILFSNKKECFQIEIKNKVLLNENTKSFEIDTILEKMEIESKKKILENFIYTDAEKENILITMELLKNKNKNILKFIKIYQEYVENISKKIEAFNIENNEDKYLAQDNIKRKILEYIRDTVINLRQLKEKTENFEKEFSESKFNDLKEEKKTVNYKKYELVAKFNPKKNEYSIIKENLLKSEYRSESLFKGILSTKKAKAKFHKNTDTLNTQVAKYCKEYFRDNFFEKKYDIEINGKSIMKMSAGEKANNLIILLFEILETKEKNIIILMDQPEDNLDNKNIYSEIVNKILKLKKENKMPQVIFVTHNSNIAISADSENIIISKKSIDNFSYENSGIEDKNFSEKICQILEGGTEALKKRGVKFSVSFIKEYGEK